MRFLSPIFRFVFCVFAVCVGVMGLVSHGFSQTNPVSAIALMPDGQLVSGSDHGLQIHDVETLKPLRKIETQIEKIYAIRTSPDGKRVAIAGGTPADLGVVEILQLPGFEFLQSFELFDDVATDIAWKSNDQLVACSMTGYCCNIQLEKTNPVPFNVHSKGILALDALTDGQIVTTGLDSSIRVWNSSEPKKARVLNNHVDVVNGISRRPSSKLSRLPMVASVSDDDTIRFWQPTIGRMVRFARLDSVPTCVSWNRDGSLAIAGCRDGSLRVVNPETADVLQTIQGTAWIHCIVLGADGEHIYIGHEDGLSRILLSQPR